MLCSASVNALQILFCNSSYESTAKWETCQIVGTSATKPATLLGISRAAVSKVIKAYTNHRKISSAKRNSDWKPNKVYRIVSKNQRNTAAKVTAELSIHLEDPVSTKTIGQELHKSNISSRAAIAISLWLLKTMLKGLKDGVIIIIPRHLIIENMYYGQKSLPSPCSQHQARFMFREHPRKPIILNAWFQLWNVEVDMWWFGQQYLGIIPLNCRITARWTGNQVNPTVQMLFPNNDSIFQDYNSRVHAHAHGRTRARAHTCTRARAHTHTHTHTHTQVFSLGLRSMKMLVRLNITETLWSVLESGSKATRSCSPWRVVQYSVRTCSELIWVYSKKDTSCITGKWWPNSILIKKCVVFHNCSHYFSICYIYIYIYCCCLFSWHYNPMWLYFSQPRTGP